MRWDQGDLKTVLADTFALSERVLARHRPTMHSQEVGTVHYVGHGIARVHGLPSVQSEELVRFPGGTLGMVFNVDPADVGIILLDDSAELYAGAEVHRTGRPVASTMRPAVPWMREARCAPPSDNLSSATLRRSWSAPR